jgi:hypothetical protein
VNSSVEKSKDQKLQKPNRNDPVYESNEGESISNLANPVGDNSSQPLFHNEQPFHHEYSDRKFEQSATDSNSNNIFITEKPGAEEDQEDAQEEEDQEDDQEDEKENVNEGQELVPYQEQEEVDIIYSEEEIMSFRNIFDMFDKEKTG